MKYRSRHDIIAMILETVYDGEATKTRLMYKAYLSYTQLREYITFLHDNGLITESQDGLYNSTQKGRRFVELYREMHNMIPLNET